MEAPGRGSEFRAAIGGLCSERKRFGFAKPTPELMDSLVLSNIFHRPARTVVSIAGIAVGVLLIVFTVGLSNGTMRERGRREGNVGAEIMFRPSGSVGMSGTETFRLPVEMAGEIARVEGVRSVVPQGQNTVAAKDNNTGNRLIDGIDFDSYAPVVGIEIIEG